VRVLLIDDDPDIALMVTMALAETGDEVIVASQSAHALTLARAARPDVVLLDLHMPGTGGDTLLARLKEDRVLAGIPVVVCSAMNDPAVIEPLIALGARGAIAKPFDPLTLRATMLRLVA
jgi:two-component system, OmpR family, response regulator